jgi:CBS domain-containing protein
MSPRVVSDSLVRDTPILTVDDPVETAVRCLLETDLPALPVVDAEGRYVGIFGEREFFAAVFPGYLSELKYAGFVPPRAGGRARKARHLPERPGARPHEH